MEEWRRCVCKCPTGPSYVTIDDDDILSHNSCKLQVDSYILPNDRGTTTLLSQRVMQLSQARMHQAHVCLAPVLRPTWLWEQPKPYAEHLIGFIFFIFYLKFFFIGVIRNKVAQDVLHSIIDFISKMEINFGSSQ